MMTCCLYCGRDTNAKFGICRKCVGVDGCRGNRSTHAGPISTHGELEDDYSAESGPDSVYRERNGIDDTLRNKP